MMMMTTTTTIKYMFKQARRLIWTVQYVIYLLYKLQRNWLLYRSLLKQFDCVHEMTYFTPKLHNIYDVIYCDKYFFSFMSSVKKTRKLMR